MPKTAKKTPKKKPTKTKKKTAKVAEVVERRDTPALTVEEQQALDQAVAFINGRVNSMARSLIDIGEYLLEKFFEGNPEQARSRAPRKGLSLRKLAQRTDLEVSYASLSNAVNLAVQEKAFADRLYLLAGSSRRLNRRTRGV